MDNDLENRLLKPAYKFVQECLADKPAIVWEAHILW